MILKNITEDTQLIMKTTRKFDQISKTVKNISKTNGEIISRLLEIGKKKNCFELFFFFFIVRKSFLSFCKPYYRHLLLMVHFVYLAYNSIINVIFLPVQMTKKKLMKSKKSRQNVFFGIVLSHYLSNRTPWNCVTILSI